MNPEKEKKTFRKNRKTILIFSNVEDGIYCFRLELLQRLLQKQYRVVLCAPPGAYTADFEKLGVARRFLRLERHGMNPLKDLILFLHYLKITASLRPNWVLTYTIKPNLYGGMAARLCRVPYLCNVTGAGTLFQKESLLTGLVRFLLRFSVKKAEVLFFQNSETMRLFASMGISGRKNLLLPGSGVCLERHPLEAYPAEDKNVKFFLIGRLCEDKGVREYLDVAQMLHGKFPHAEWHLAGPLEEEPIAARIDELVKQHLVVYHGPIHPDRIHATFTEASCIVLPSYHEGMANVLLEGAATGRPCIASDIPGCREIVEDGVTGFLCRAKDHLALLQAVERFLQLPWETRRNMGIAGRKKVEREFNREIVISKYLDFIH